MPTAATGDPAATGGSGSGRRPRRVLADEADGRRPVRRARPGRRSPSAIPRAGPCWWPTCRPATPPPATRSSCSTTPPARSHWPWRARRWSTPGGRPPRCAGRRPSSGSSCRRSATSSARRSPPSRATPRRCSSPTSPGTRRRPTASCGRSPARGRGSERLVGDLLDSTAIESGVLRLQRHWCDLAAGRRGGACAWCATGSTIRVRADADLEPVWADHDRLEQVFVNLLENAVAHGGPPDGIDVTLRRGASRAPSRSRSPTTAPASRRARRPHLRAPRARPTPTVPAPGWACRSPGGSSRPTAGTLEAVPAGRGACVRGHAPV